MNEAVLAAELRARHGVTTRQRLRGLGFADRVIDGLIGRGRLQLIARGVLADAAATRTFAHRVVAACAATNGVASFPTAGLLWELRKTPRVPEIHITVPWARRVTSPAGVVVHRSRCLPTATSCTGATGST